MILVLAQAIFLPPGRSQPDLDKAIGYNDQANLYLGDLLYIACRYDEANAALEKAPSINPRLEGAHANLSQILIARNQPQLALEEIAKEPGKWERLTVQALAYHDFGRK